MRKPWDGLKNTDLPGLQVNQAISQFCDGRNRLKMKEKTIQLPFRSLKGIFLFLIMGMVLVQGVRGKIDYPWDNVYMGALQAQAWSGMVFVPRRDSGFAFRIQVKKEDTLADGMDLFYLVSEVGPHSPDGQYARMKFDMSLPFDKGKKTPILQKPASKSDRLVLEWSRQDEGTVVGKIQAPQYIQLRLFHYFPWNFEGKYQHLSDGHVKGESQTLKKYHYLLWTSRKGEVISPSQGQELTQFFSTDERKLYFVAGVGEDPKILRNHIYRYKNEKTIDSLLEEEEKRYKKRRVRVDGLYEGVPKAVTNNLFWMILYQSGKHRLYTPAGRRWIFPRSEGKTDFWTIFEWDSFFNALEVSIESPFHAKEILKAVLNTQYPNGNIPNWRGFYGGTQDRSQPPVGSYVVLKIFLKTGDMEMLKYAYPYLKKWHDFWKAEDESGQPRRDGNRDGLLEWGSDTELVSSNVPPWEKDVPGIKRAMWESGQDDLPNWDEASFNEETDTMTMNCVDLNSLYALDSWCLAQIANALNRKYEYESYLQEYKKMKELINNNLWDDRKGFYFDQHWDGRLSYRKAASNFYPLLARIPDEDQAMRMVKHLLNPDEFWGDYVIPTISRGDPAFVDQQYWRGAIWPPTNYMVYEGLKAYHFDGVASEFAKKSTSLFLRTWKNFQICPENFNAQTGEAGGQRYQSWGPLLSLMGVEEYLDFTPWEGFRFGRISPSDKGKLSRVSIQGRHYEVMVSSSKIKLKEEGDLILKCNGAAVFRHFLYSEEEVSFEMKALESRKVKVWFLTKGKYQIFIDGQAQEIFKGNRKKFKVPSGEHTVTILLLEKKSQ